MKRTNESNAASGESITCFKTTFGLRTSPDLIEDFALANFPRLHRRALGPSPGSRLIFVVDDLCTPSADKFGTQTSLELMRQLVQEGGFFERQALHFLRLQDTAFLAAATSRVGQNGAPDLR